MAMAWAPDYCSVEELAAFVRIGDAVDDVQLSLAIATASRAVDQATGRQFGRVDAPTARYNPMPWWDRRHLRWILAVEDLMTVTGLAVAYDSAGDQTYATAITGAVPRPVNAVADGRPWTELAISSALFPFGPSGLFAFPGVGPAEIDSFGRLVAPREDVVRVTAQWGWPGVPDPIRQATLLQASRLLSRRDSPFGVAGSPEVGSELRLLARLDPDVAVAVRPYKRVWGAV
jgi:hypothetical protein